MKRMSRSALALVVVTALSALSGLAGCHLADSADPVKCETGTHPSDGHCANDVVVAVHITILPGEGGASCSVSPDAITVAPNAEFELQNTDGVEHVIAGADGTAWATVKAGQVSPLIGITKVGSWPYTVSGCAKGGTVVVQ
jgi:hypothetical protein